MKRTSHHLCDFFVVFEGARALVFPFTYCPSIWMTCSETEHIYCSSSSSFSWQALLLSFPFFLLFVVLFSAFSFSFLFCLRVASYSLVAVPMGSSQERDTSPVRELSSGNPVPSLGSGETADLRNEDSAENNDGPSNRGFSVEEILDSERRDITPEVNSVIRKLLYLQKRCNLSTRFHLLVERDVDDVVTQWARYGSSNISKCSRTETRILMSPTLSFGTEEMRKVSKPMTRQLSAASFVGLQAAISLDRETSRARSTSQERRTEMGSTPSRTNREGALVGRPFWEPFDEWEDVFVPNWFPFLYERYTTGPQVSATELLEISSSVVRNFEALSKEAVEIMWPRFFRTLHDGVRRKDKRYPKLSFKYTLYTPPWLRKQIKTGHQLLRIGEVTIRPMRSQRSDWGYRTMALILAGFYEKERHFARSILTHLITYMPSMYRKEKAGTKSSRGIGDNHPVGNSQNNLRLSINGSSRNGTRKIPLNEEMRPIRIERKKDEQTADSRLSDPNAAGPSTAAPRSVHQPYDTQNEGTAETQESKKAEDGKEDKEVEANQNELLIACVARSACLLKLDPEAQVLSKITGKCSKCRCALHDLCGGGEDGDMLCYNCRKT